MKRILWSTLVAALVLLSASGCKKDDDDDSSDTDVEENQAASIESALMAVASSEASTSITADQVAQIAAGKANDVFKGADCDVMATYSATPGASPSSTVVYTLDDCTGPYGLVHVTGTLNATYSVDAMKRLNVHVVGSGLKVNRSTLDIDSTAIFTQSGALKTLSVSSTGKETGPRGVVANRTGNYTVSLDQSDASAPCVGVDGTITTTTETTPPLTWQIDYAGVRRCGDRCPDAGGVITYSGGLGLNFTIKYDGSDEATWTVSGNESRHEIPDCDAAG